MQALWHIILIRQIPIQSGTPTGEHGRINPVGAMLLASNPGVPLLH
jgi:hypothetical protein